MYSIPWKKYESGGKQDACTWVYMGVHGIWAMDIH
jgi:hypothetical protein